MTSGNAHDRRQLKTQIEILQSNTSSTELEKSQWKRIRKLRYFSIGGFSEVCENDAEHRSKHRKDHGQVDHISDIYFLAHIHNNTITTLKWLEHLVQLRKRKQGYQWQSIEIEPEYTFHARNLKEIRF